MEYPKFTGSNNVSTMMYSKCHTKTHIHVHLRNFKDILEVREFSYKPLQVSSRWHSAPFLEQLSCISSNFHLQSRTQENQPGRYENQRQKHITYSSQRKPKTYGFRLVISWFYSTTGKYTDVSTCNVSKTHLNTVVN